MNSESHTSLLQEKWSGWIPTNLGELQFEYITQEQNQKNFPILKFDISEKKDEISITLDARKLSDSIKYYEILTKKSKWKEIQAKVSYLKIIQKDKHFEGNIVLKYSMVSVSATFVVSLNGMVEFSNLSYTDTNVLKDDIIDNHRLALYILLKSVIHGDNHHHQKIDVALKVTVGDFKPEIILHNLLIHIKSIERNIKRLSKCSTKLAAQQAYHELEGYISYCKAFYEIFDIQGIETPVYPKYQYNNLENIKNSAKAKIDKIDKENTFTKNFFTTLITLSALFIAINILNKPLDKELFHVNKFLYFLPFSLLIIVEGCYIIHWLRSKFYEDYETIKHLIHVDTRMLSTRGNINQKIILILPVFGILFAVVYFIYSISPLLITESISYFGNLYQNFLTTHFTLTLLCSIGLVILVSGILFKLKLNSK